MHKHGSHGRDGSDFRLQTMCSGPSLIFIWEAGSSPGLPLLEKEVWAAWVGCRGLVRLSALAVLVA